MLSDILELINFSWCLSFGIQLVLLAYIQLFRGGVLEIRAAASCLFPSSNADMVHNISLEGHCLTKLRIY